MPELSEQINGRSNTLLSTVDEGVQILADLVDILDSSPLDLNTENITSSPLMGLLTNYLIPKMAMPEIHGSQEERALRQEDDNTPKEEID